MRLVAFYAVTLIAVSSMALAQSQSQQPQPSDPTAQAPAAKAPPPKRSTTAAHPQEDSSRTFIGEILLENGGYYLRSGNDQYRLDDQSKAKELAGQTVQVVGILQGNVLHVKSMEPR
jgi:hypothetical protein